jgi:hypothetical protein
VPGVGIEAFENGQMDGCLGAAQPRFRKAHRPGLPVLPLPRLRQAVQERSPGSPNRTQYPSDVIVPVVLWRLRYTLSLRDLPEMVLICGIVFSHEAVRDWEIKLTPAIG